MPYSTATITARGKRFKQATGIVASNSLPRQPTGKAALSCLQIAAISHSVRYADSSAIPDVACTKNVSNDRS